MTDRIYLDKEFDRFWAMVEGGENFAVIRHGDGEHAIMEGRSITAQEGWKSPEHISELGRASIDALQIDADNFWYGISCPCCDPKAYYWYVQNIKSTRRTFANLFINCNYHRFIELFSNLKRDAVVIANHTAAGKQIGSLNILDFYAVGDDCIGFWEKDAKKLIDKIKKDYGKRKDLLYVVSAGPMSGPIIAELYKNNPDNCYLDFGSAIDKFIHERVTRFYMDKSTSYARRHCWMHNQDTFELPGISVVCTLYKKPDALRKQVMAIRSQSIKPVEVLLFQDGIANDYKIELQPELCELFDDVHVCPTNVGVWGRFEYARKRAKGEYVCVFDDDTIPGKQWLANCMGNMWEVPGIYGTTGVVLAETAEYPCDGWLSVGWKNPNSKRAEVDFVGHSWFLKTQWLNYMFDGTEKYQDLRYVAEDMTLSVQCLKHGIKTFVPPHPVKHLEMWGSQPDSAWAFGLSSVAVHLNPNNAKMMTTAVKMHLAAGWAPLFKRDSDYAKHMQKKMRKKKNRIKKIWKIFRDAVTLRPIRKMISKAIKKMMEK
jgi:hypothetical protein